MSEDLKEVQMKQILALSLENTPESRIAEQLNISRYHVKKIRNSDLFKSALKDLGDQAVSTAKESFKAKMEELAPLAYNALKQNLQEGKIEAVRTFIQVVGLTEKQEQVNQDTTIQVILPGMREEKVIEVENEN